MYLYHTVFIIMALKGNRLHIRVRDDDVAAFEKLFRTYYAELVNYAYSFLKDLDVSEEIVQDFFYNYWKNRKRIIIRVSIKSYFYRAIKNNCLKYLDAVAVRRKYAEKIMEDSNENIGYEGKELEFYELHGLIEEILAELPDRCGQIFRLSRFEGLKYEEIAKELSVSVKTVEANMGKALKLLRERLARYYGQDDL